MAHVLKRMLKSCPCVLDLTRSSALRSLPIRRSWVRYYAPNYKKRVPEEDLKEMKEYREKVLALRRQYREQWRAKVLIIIIIMSILKSIIPLLISRGKGWNRLVNSLMKSYNKKR